MKRLGKLTGNYLRMADMPLMLLCVAAAVFGMVIIFSATRSYENGRYMPVQAFALVLGLVFFVVFSLIDVDILTDRWYFLVGFNLLLLVALRVFGVEGETGNRSWIRFGGIGIQPSELLKITFALLLMRQITRLQESKKGISGVFSAFSLAIHFALLFGVYVVISADAGNALVFLRACRKFVFKRLLQINLILQIQNDPLRSLGPDARDGAQFTDRLRLAAKVTVMGDAEAVRFVADLHQHAQGR